MDKNIVISTSDDQADKLDMAAKEKGEVRLELVETAKKLATSASEREDVNIAIKNLLEDLTVEKSKVEMAKAKRRSDVSFRWRWSDYHR
jgi:hypothetical protein